MLPVIAEVVRSGFVEGHHYGSVVAIDAGHEVVHARGEVGTPILPRSCNKPLQALGMVRAGLDLDGELLALACASHSGEDFHVEGVRTILAHARLPESALQNPPGWPLDDRVRDDLVRAGGEASRLHMNCSGKHAAMLATCVVNGWPTESYRDPAHPLQQAIAATLAELTGEPVGPVAVDGCGAPLLGINGASIVCHGASPVKAIKNGVRVAAEWVKNDVNQHIKTALEAEAMLAEGREGGRE